MAQALESEIVRYVAPGTIGDPEVMSALTDVPVSQVKRLVLPGYGVRLQPLEDVRQDFVKRDLTEAWNGRGTPFYGATTLVRAMGEQAPISMVEVPAERWDREVKPRIEDWNYHEAGWFRFQTIYVPTPRKIYTCLAEFIPEGLDYPQPEEGYMEDPVVKNFLKVMASSVFAYRTKFEGYTPQK